MIYTDNIMLEEFKASMKTKFEMIDLGLMNFFWGIDVDQYFHDIFLYQQKYAMDILKTFRLDKCKLSKTHIALGTKLRKQYEWSIVDSTLYKRLVGSLMYLTLTKHAIMYATSFVSMFMESSKDSH
jgi:hypothetical protein